MSLASCVCGVVVHSSVLFARLRGKSFFNFSFKFHCFWRLIRLTMERNHKEDQNNEVEALESIYCEDFEGINIDKLISSEST